jgi:tRNA1Val (adenine37-N6)-methyltransferase
MLANAPVSANFSRNFKHKMPNSFFRFKQFTVHQDKCAMKVCTDACLFGAWVADSLQNTPLQHVLDIGTGTGLLSLMLAQKIDAPVDAVEKNLAAAMQAAQNFEASAWKERLTILHEDITAFTSSRRYQLVISNPPFYEADLKSSNMAKNDARHDSALTLDVLINIASQLLDTNGLFAVLLPWHRSNYFISLAKQAGLHLQQQAMVRQSVHHDFFRSMLLLGKSVPAELQTEEISIKDAAGNYTPAFTRLLKAYYLYL